MFKLIKEGVNMKHCSLSSTSTRGHLCKIYLSPGCQQFSLALRPVNNSLSEEIVARNSLRIFKSKTDKFLKGLLPFAKATNKTHPHCDQSHQAKEKIQPGVKQKFSFTHLHTDLK